MNGFTPLRAGTAGFFFSFRFSAPANLNEPVFLSSSPMTVKRPSTTAFTSFGFNSVASATAAYAALAVMPAAAFIAFIAFMALGAIGDQAKRATRANAPETQTPC